MMDEAEDSSHKRIPAGERAGHVFLAVLLLVYGTYGLSNDDLYIPGKHSRGVHLHGVGAWIMYGAFLCGAINLISVAVDHCDSSAGERKYKAWARATQVVGWVLFAAALLAGLLYRKQSGW